MTRNTESPAGIRIDGQLEPVILVTPKAEVRGFSDCYDERHAECPAVYEGAGLILAACGCSCHGFGQDSPLVITEANPHLRTDADVWRIAKLATDSSTKLYRNLRRDGFDD